MALQITNGNETERICDIMLTYCDADKAFGNKLAGERSGAQWSHTNTS